MSSVIPAPAKRMTSFAATVLPKTFIAVRPMSRKASIPAMRAIASTGRPTVVNTVASLFYYLHWLVPALLQRPGEASAEALRPAGGRAALAAYAAGAASLALGIAGAVVLPLVTGHLIR